jgi:hypothetical protein
MPGYNSAVHFIGKRIENSNSVSAPNQRIDKV